MGFEPTRSIANDIDRVLYVIPPLHRKKFSRLIRSKGYSPTDLNQFPWRTYIPYKSTQSFLPRYRERPPLTTRSAEVCGCIGNWTRSVGTYACGLDISPHQSGTLSHQRIHPLWCHSVCRINIWKEYRSILRIITCLRKELNLHLEHHNDYPCSAN